MISKLAETIPSSTPNLLADIVPLAPEPPVEHAKPALPRRVEEPLREVRPPAERRPTLLGKLAKMIVLAAIAVGTYYAWPWIVPWISLVGRKPVVKPPQRVVPVVTAVTRQGDMPLYLNGLGTVTAFFTVTVRSRVEGQLVAVRFTEGQIVKKDDVLAEIDPRPYEVQLAQAEGQLARDQATLKVNKLSLSRYNDLVPTRAITPQQVDEQVALVDQMEGAVRADRAAIDNARLQLVYCEITAPISGRIGLRLVDPGNMVRANDMGGIAVITQLQPIAIVFTIPQDSISQVQRKANTGETLVVEAYDRDFKTRLATGKLLAIDNQVDATTGTVRLKAVFDNEDNLLFPNQFVNARLLIDNRVDAVIVPSATVQRGPDFDFVYLVKKGEGDEQTVDLREVKVGPTEGDQTVIEEGLVAGDRVVTDGVEKLQRNAKISERKR